MLPKSLSQFILLLIYAYATLCQDLPSFRIIAPQNLCKPDEAVNVTKNPEGVTITFQPRDDVKFSYKFRIFFKTLATENFTQRETLLIWKAVRTLEHRININDRLAISKQNMLFIKKSELISGVTYLFHVYGITDAGETSEEQIFRIKYVEGVLENEDVPEGINLLLIGSEITVASLAYSLYAKITFCTPKYNYYVRWKVQNLDEEYAELQRVITTTLHIPRNVFKAGTKTSIEAQVLELDTSKLLAKDSIEVTILSRGMQTYIIPSAARIGTDTSLSFHLYINDFDNNMDNIEIFWEYLGPNHLTEEVSEICHGSTKCRIIFQKPGSYQVTANIKLNDVVMKAFSDVEVVPHIILSYDFINIPNMNPATNESFRFGILVMDLIPSCRVGWTCAQEDGFMYISQDEVGKESFGQTVVANLEKNYLSEISDFDNYTVNKEVLLYIPQPFVSGYQWRGLQGDVNYKFRLDAVCPTPYTNQNPIQETVSSHFDIIVHTNSPPTVGVVRIIPRNGIALKTIFHISVSGAKDLLLDTPISYELCGYFDSFEICFGKYFEYKVWETILPNTKSLPELIIKVCDIRKACKIVNEKNVSVKYENLSEDDLEGLKQSIAAAFSRTDYKEAQNIILITAITFKNNNAAQFNDWRRFVAALMEREVNKLLEYPTNTLYITQDNIIRFVSQAIVNFSVLRLNNSKSLERLLEILEQMSSSALPSSSGDAFFAEEKSLAADGRNTRQIIDPVQSKFESSFVVDMKFASINLLLIHDIFTLSDNNEEKLKIFERVNSLLEKMCYSEVIIHESLESATVSISVEKIYGMFLVKKDFTIPKFYTKNTGMFKFQVNKDMISADNVYCIAIAQYPMDYFTNEGAVLTNIKVYDLTSITTVMEFKEDKLEEKEIKHMLQLKMSKSKYDENTCLLRVGSTWSSRSCNVQNSNVMHVSCTCSHAGYFRLAAMRKHEDGSAPINIRPTPQKGIISFPNENHITVNILNTSMATTEVTSTPFTMMTIVTKSEPTTVKLMTIVTKVEPTTVKPTESTAIAHTTAVIHQIDPKSQQNVQLDSSNVQKSSMAIYIIPLALILLILPLIIIFALYYRRKMKSKDLQNPIFNTNLEIRQRKQGIKYAQICDDHLIRGSF